MRMATFLVLSVGLLAVTGCSSNNKGKIEGTKWSSEAATLKGQSVRAGAVQLEFNKDGTFVYKGDRAALTGKYDLGSGDTVNMHFNQELAGRKDHAEKVTISGDRLTMTDSDGTQISFTKVK